MDYTIQAMPLRAARSFLVLFITCSLAAMSEQGCSPPPPIPAGSYEPVLTDYAYESEIVYSCENGYQLEGIERRSCVGIKIINSFTWSGDDPECVAVSCSLPQIPHALYEEPTTTSYKTTITYECVDGLVPLGPQTATCTAAGLWQYELCRDPEFSCEGNLPEVPHASHNGTSTARHPTGTVISYKCDRGYKMNAGADSLTCVKTSWNGTLPSCSAVDRMDEPSDGSGDSGGENAAPRLELPIIAGAVTALILTSVLVITVSCIRRRRLNKLPRKACSIASSSPTSSSTPSSGTCLTPNQSFRLPKPMSPTGDNQYFGPTIYHRPDTPSNSSRTNMAMMRHAEGTLSTALSSPCSATSAENTPSEAEFHTIRECLGDFRNNNAAAPALTLQHTHSCPKLSTRLPADHSHSVLHRTMAPHQPFWPHPHMYHTCRPATPYETVTCPHGIEHVYQPLEHVYEEPHIWMQPLPDPHK